MPQSEHKRIPLSVTPEQYTQIRDWGRRRGLNLNAAIRLALFEAGVLQDASVTPAMDLRRPHPLAEL